MTYLNLHLIIFHKINNHKKLASSLVHISHSSWANFFKICGLIKMTNKIMSYLNNKIIEKCKKNKF